MWKKILLSVSLIVISVFGIEIFNYSRNKKTLNENNTNTVTNEVDISSKFIEDECTNEWNDYALTLQEKIREASELTSDENRKYIVKPKDEFIAVYYINNEDEEILYKVTDISIEYLSEEDIQRLKKGIEARGVQELNQILEDFE